MKTTRTTKIVTLFTALMIIVSVLFAFGRDTALANFVQNAWQGYKLTEGLVGYWSFDGRDMTTTTALDKSGNGNTGTLTSTIATIGKNGQSLTFNGTSSFIDAGNPASLNLSGVNKFTLSAWVYPTSAPQGAGVISEMYDPTTTTVQYEIGFGINEAPGGSTFLKVGFFDGTWRLAADSVSATLNEWVLITGTWDGTTLSLYKNGIFVTSSTPGVSLPAANFDKVVIGRRHDTGGTVDYFPGKIDEPRIYNRALSADEVKRLYLMGASLKTNVSHRDELTEGLVGNWTFDGRDIDLSQSTAEARDTSGQGNNGNWVNHATTTTIGKMGQGIALDGVDDYVISGVNGTTWTQLTLSLWINPSGNTATQKGILQWSNTLTDTTPFMLIARDTTYGLRLYLDNDYRATGIVIPDNAWSHIAVTLNAANLWTLYVNGVSVATYQDDATHQFQARAASIYLGNGYNGYFVGGIDEARVYNRGLSTDEVKRLYFMGASLKTNVSHRDELTEGLVGYWTFDGKDIDISQVTAEVRDRSGQGNNGDWKNHATTTTIGKIGQAIDIFSSGVDVNAYIEIGDPGSGVLDFAGDFAVGFWMKGSGYVSQGSSNNAAVSKRNLSSANSAGYSFHYVSTNLMGFSIANGSATFAVEQTTATVADGKWHHYVGIRSGGDIYLYVDGVLVNSGTGVSGSMVTASSLIVGTDASVTPNNRNSNAVIDEVRVYDRALAPEEVKRLYLMGM